MTKRVKPRDLNRIELISTRSRAQLGGFLNYEGNKMSAGVQCMCCATRQGMTPNCVLDRT